MIVRLFNTNQFTGIIYLIFFLGILYSFVFINTIPPSEKSSQGVLFQFLFLDIFRYKGLHLILGSLMMLSQALFFNYFVVQLNVLFKNTYLPAFFYMLVSGLLPQNVYINPVLVSMNFVLPSLYLFFQILHSKYELRSLFYASMTLGIGSFFYFNVIYYLVFFWLVLLFLGIISLRKWLSTLLGFLTPYTYLMMYFYWNDRFGFFINTHLIPNLHVLNPIKMTYSWDVFSLFILVTVVLLFSIYKFRQMQMNFKVIQRKLFMLLGYYFAITSVTLFFATAINLYHIILYSVPVALFMAFYFLELKRKWMADVLLLLIFTSMFIIRINYYS